MRHVSGKRRRLLAERRKLLKRMDQPESCPRCHREPVAEAHEILRRAQHAEGAADLELMVPLGRTCHDWVTTHPTEAHDQGWVIWRHELEDAELIRETAWQRLEYSLGLRALDKPHDTGEPTGGRHGTTITGRPYGPVPKHRDTPRGG